jgi:hypothetical protein
MPLRRWRRYCILANLSRINPDIVPLYETEVRGVDSLKRMAKSLFTAS